MLEELLDPVTGCPILLPRVDYNCVWIPSALKTKHRLLDLHYNSTIDMQVA